AKAIQEGIIYCINNHLLPLSGNRLFGHKEDTGEGTGHPMENQYDSAADRAMRSKGDVQMWHVDLNMVLSSSLPPQRNNGDWAQGKEEWLITMDNPNILSTSSSTLQEGNNSLVPTRWVLGFGRVRCGGHKRVVMDLSVRDRKMTTWCGPVGACKAQVQYSELLVVISIGIGAKAMGSIPKSNMLHEEDVRRGIVG
ncbi:hypothetical protein HAX54_001553, partial [Datura stramonium]|nr:hypothetical protein [Datura stramonium]